MVRFSSIGDIVLTSPLLRCLRLQTGAEIHYLTKKIYRPLLVENPYIDCIHTIEKEITEVVKTLKTAKFDLIVDLHHNIRTLRLKLNLGIKSVAFPKLNVEKWLLTNFKINRLPHIHIVERYMSTVHPLGVKYDGKGLDYFFPESAYYPARKILGKETTFLVFAIGGKYATKRLPKEKILSICKKINHPIILLGGKEDADCGAFIEKNGGETIKNACGLLSLNQAASIIQQAQLLITHDTGMMHIGAAFKKKIISIWGNTTPDFGMYPFYPNHQAQFKILEAEGVTCRPCSKIGFQSCPKKHFDCMNKIDEKQLVESVKEYWSF